MDNKELDELFGDDTSTPIDEPNKQVNNEEVVEPKPELEKVGLRQEDIITSEAELNLTYSNEEIEALEEDIVVEEDEDDNYKANIEEEFNPPVMEEIKERKVTSDDLNVNEIVIEEDGAEEDEEAMPDRVTVDYSADVAEWIMNNDLLFGKSETSVEMSDTSDPVILLKRFRYYGEYIDIYLPISNIGVRIFEFDNNAFFDEYMLDLASFENNVFNSASKQSTIITRRLLAAIRDNSILLCKDAELIDKKLSFDKLSAMDVNLLLLGAAVLLNRFRDGKKKGMDGYDDTYTYPRPCPHCSAPGTVVDVQLNLLNVMKDIYANTDIANLQENIDGYDASEKFEDKLKRSHMAKSFSVVAKSKGKGPDRQFRETSVKVSVSYPSYTDLKIVEDEIYVSLLSRHREFINTITKEILSFNTYSNTAKINSILLTIRERQLRGNDNLEGLSDFITDYTRSMVVPYIRSITHTDETGKTIVSEFQSQTIYRRLEMVSILRKSMINSITTIIDKIRNTTLKPFVFKYKCPKCGGEIEDEMDPVFLFLGIVMRLVNKEQ